MLQLCNLIYFNCRMPAVQVSRAVCLFLAASSFMSPLDAAGKCYRHHFFNLFPYPPLLIILKKNNNNKQRLIPFSCIQTNVLKWLIRNAYEKVTHNIFHQQNTSICLCASPSTTWCLWKKKVVQHVT